MRWFGRDSDHAEATREFDELVDDVIEDFEAVVRMHRRKLEALKEAARGR